MTAARYAAEIVGTDIPHVDEGRYNAKFDGVEVTTHEVRRRVQVALDWSTYPARDRSS